MENPNVENILEKLAKEHLININIDKHMWLINVAHEHLIFNKAVCLWKLIRAKIYSFLLKNTDHADVYYGLGIDQPLSVHIFPVYVETQDAK